MTPVRHWRYHIAAIRSQGWDDSIDADIGRPLSSTEYLRWLKAKAAIRARLAGGAL